MSVNITQEGKEWGPQKVSSVLASHSCAQRGTRLLLKGDSSFLEQSCAIAGLSRMSEMGNIRLPFVYLYVVAQ